MCNSTPEINGLVHAADKYRLVQICVLTVKKKTGIKLHVYIYFLTLGIRIDQRFKN